MTTDKNGAESTIGESDLDALGNAGSDILSERLRDSLPSISFGTWQPTVDQAVVEEGSEGHQPRPLRWNFGRPKRKPSPAREAIPHLVPDAKVDSNPVTSPKTVPAEAVEAATPKGPTSTATTTTTMTQPAARRGRRRDGSIDAAGLPEVLTVDETAALLRVDRKSAYAMIARHEIPGVRKIGRTIRVSRDAVVEWMRQGDVVHGRRKP